MRAHDVGFGVSLSLPLSWTADSQADLSALRERSLDRMGGSSLQHLRDLAHDNSNALLFRATESANPRNSVSLNVTVDPEVLATWFDAADPAELAGMVEYICELFAGEAAESGGEANCTGHEVRTLEGRGVLVLSQRATIPAVGIDNRRVVAMIPAEGLLFTLSLSVGHADYDPGMVNALLASITIPSE